MKFEMVQVPYQIEGANEDRYFWGREHESILKGLQTRMEDGTVQRSRNTQYEVCCYTAMSEEGDKRVNRLTTTRYPASLLSYSRDIETR